MAWLPASWPKRIALLLLAAAFTYAGITHFTGPEFFVAIVPPYLPEPLLLVYVSGVAEIAGGLGVLVPRLRRLAGYGLLALLVAVFPANIHMALNPELFPQMSPTALIVRLPIQFVLAAWVWWATKPDATAA
jgi:uncharacterized membrane protein